MSGDSSANFPPNNFVCLVNGQVYHPLLVRGEGLLLQMVEPVEVSLQAAVQTFQSYPTSWNSEMLQHLLYFSERIFKNLLIEEKVDLSAKSCPVLQQLQPA